MNTQVYRLALLFTLLGLLVAGCAAPAAAPTPTAVPPTAAPLPEPTQVPAAEAVVDPDAAVVLDMAKAVNAEDFAAAAEFFTDDAMIYFIGMPPAGMEIYRGKEQMRTMLEECCTGQHFVWEIVPENVEDDIVYADASTWMDFTRDLGVAPNRFREVFVIDDGKIDAYYSMFDEESLAEFKPALYAVMPLPEAAASSTDEPTAEISVTIADGTCAYDGPTTVRAGNLTVTADVQDHDKDMYAVTFFTIAPYKDFVDLMASTARPGPPRWSQMISIEQLAPGETMTYEFPVEPGQIYMICWSSSPDMAIGQGGPFEVVE